MRDAPTRGFAPSATPFDSNRPTGYRKPAPAKGCGFLLPHDESREPPRFFDWQQKDEYAKMSGSQTKKQNPYKIFGAMKINLESASEQDLQNILGLQKRAFYGQALIYNDHTLPSLTQTIEDLVAEFGQMTFYKVEIDGKLAASVRCRIRERTLHIEKLIVEPALQNRGIGKRVMGEIEKCYSSVVDRYELATGHKSARNLHLYTSLGYREIARKALNPGCDLVVLAKPANEWPDQES